MKVKKEYILLALLIISSVGYLVMQKTDRVHYTLPALEALDAEAISGIEILREGAVTKLTRHDASWRISPQNWRADQTRVSEMVGALAKLTVTELVSESKDYDRYQLDEGRKAVIRAYAGAEVRREFSIGKAAPTYNHTYVALPGDERVYLAGGDLPRLFAVQPSEFRDMLVLSLSPRDIERIEIRHRGKVSTIAKSEVPPGDAVREAADDRAKVYTWKNGRGGTVEKADVDTFLAGLATVYCGEYLDDALKAGLSDPETVIVMSAAGGSTEHRLSIFPKTEGGAPALSSLSESPFVMPEYKMEEMEKSLNKILE